jgi:hypothetical protein
MDKVLVLLFFIFITSCDNSTKNNIDKCINLGVEKKVAEAECNTTEGLINKVRYLTNKKLNENKSLLSITETINKKFEKYVKDKLVFQPKVVIDIDQSAIFSSSKVTDMPFFYRKAGITNKSFYEESSIYIGRSFLKEQYSFISPPFDGRYELRNDRTTDKSFSIFYEECSKIPHCTFSVAGTISAVKPENDGNGGKEWVGWVDVDDFSFNKFKRPNPKIGDIENYVIDKVINKKYPISIEYLITEYIYAN